MLCKQVSPVVIATVLWGPFDASYVLRSFLNPAFRPARRCVSEHSLQRATHRRPPFLCFIGSISEGGEGLRCCMVRVRDMDFTG